MARDQRELSAAEKRRLANFNLISEELLEQRYRKTDLTCSVVKANTDGILYGLLVSIPFIVIYVLLNVKQLKQAFHVVDSFFSRFAVFWIILLILIVVHELIHGITWSRFTQNGFKDIEFGVIWKMLTPYCTCKEPLKKVPYILGTAMPCIVLGILPCIISWFTHSGWLLGIGVLMILSAGGDLLIIAMILKNKASASALYLDHPTEVGLIVFEK